MALGQLGYDAGFADGTMSNKTRQALQQYQEDLGLPVTGEIDDGTAFVLLSPSLSTRS